MKLVIDIPEEFENHFNEDRFEDSLHRLSADAHLIAGNYEQEIAIMLINSFKNSKPLPKGHGRLIDADELKANINGWYNFMRNVCNQPYITLKQEDIIGKIDMQKIIIEADKGE